MDLVRDHSPGPAGRPGAAVPPQQHPSPPRLGRSNVRGSPSTPGGVLPSPFLSDKDADRGTQLANTGGRKPRERSRGRRAPRGHRQACAGRQRPATQTPRPGPSGPATPAPPGDPGALRLPYPAIPARSDPRSRVRHHHSRETRAAGGAAGPGTGGSAGGGVRRPGRWPWAALTVAVVLLHGAGAGADAGLRARLAARPSRPAAFGPARLCRAPSPAPGPRLPRGAPPAAARRRPRPHPRHAATSRPAPAHARQGPAPSPRPRPAAPPARALPSPPRPPARGSLLAGACARAHAQAPPPGPKPRPLARSEAHSPARGRFLARACARAPA